MKARSLERWYRVLLLAFPADFRRRHGDEMLATVAELHHRALATGRSGVAFWAGLVIDAVAHGAAERLRTIRNARHDPPLRTGARDRMRALLLDLTMAGRALRARPRTALAVVLMLALGIGSTTTMFGALDAVVLRPVPLPEPDRLATLVERHPASGRHEEASAPNYVDWRERVRSMESLAAWRAEERVLAGDGEPAMLPVLRVSASFFEVLDVVPVLGRTFTAAEELPGSEQIVILGHGLWRTRYGGDTAMLGRTIQLDDAAHLVVGVMPPGFRFADGEPQALVPLAFAPYERPYRAKRMFHVLGRLVPGRTFDDAQTEMRAIAADLAASFPATNAGWTADVLPLEEVARADSRPLLALFGAVAFILLIACVNAAHLLLIRGAERERELAIRVSLGASRGRVVRQLSLETLILALVAGSLGVLLAWVATGSLDAWLPLERPGWREPGIDVGVLGFALAASTIAAIAAGLAPALQAATRDAGPMLHVGDRTTESRRVRRTRAMLVGCEVALTFVLLAGAGLFVRSLDALSRVDPGFDPAGRLVATIQLVESRYESDRQQMNFVSSLLERLRNAPGVTGAAAVTTLPLSTAGIDHDIAVWDAARTATGAEMPQLDFRAATPGYFDAMGIRMRLGRSFADHDDADAPGVAVINDAAARALFGGGTPIGRRIVVGDGDTQFEIVGLVADVHHRALDAAPRPELYVPLAQWPSYGTVEVVVRGRDALALVPSVKAAVFALDPSQPIAQVSTMTELVNGSMSAYRLRTRALAAFSMVGVLLAAVGIYCVVAFAVSRRTRELGIRLALGARQGQLAWLVAVEGLGPVAAGLLAGIAAAVAIAPAAGHLLFGVEPADPLALGGAALVLGLIAGAASMIPATRTGRIDPVKALRAD